MEQSPKQVKLLQDYSKDALQMIGVGLHDWSVHLNLLFVMIEKLPNKHTLKPLLYSQGDT